MTPAASSPGVSGKTGACAYCPWRNSVSAKLMPIARLRISTVPLVASGVGASASFRTSGPPILSNWICFTQISFYLARPGTARTRMASLFQRRFDELHSVVAPEHRIADEKGGRAECAARDRLLGVGLQALLHLVALDRVRIHSKLREHLLDDLRIAEVHALGPHRAKHHRMISGKASRGLRDDRTAHCANSAQRKKRIDAHRHAVVMRPPDCVDGVVIELGGNRGRRRVVGSLENAAEQDRFIDDACAGLFEQRGQLRVGEIAERTYIVIEKFQLLRHRPASLDEFQIATAKLAIEVSICNYKSAARGGRQVSTVRVASGRGRCDAMAFR